MKDRNATSAQAVARWLVAHTGLTARGEQIAHIADALNVGTVQARKYLAGTTAMTEARLTEACDCYGLSVWYSSATGWICSALEGVDDADAE